MTEEGGQVPVEDRGRGSCSAYLTGVWGEREVNLNCILVYFSFHKPLFGFLRRFGLGGSFFFKKAL